VRMPRIQAGGSGLRSEMSLIGCKIYSRKNFIMPS
jgi:hypothetical protein